jgi:hypothetical protein
MPEINAEMQENAEYAISIAKESYGFLLDYSEKSLSLLDDILLKIYWGFSGQSMSEGKGGLVYNTAIIWGSYLGEYMRLKWGGTWIYKGKEQCISINNIMFSPIKFIYQRVSSHPEFRVKDFVQEAKNLIDTAAIFLPESQNALESISQPVERKTIEPEKKPLIIDKRMIYITGGVVGALVILAVCIVGYKIISSKGLPVFTLFAGATVTNSVTPAPVILVSPTLSATDTAFPTVTVLPTYTPKPTKTIRPTNTPTLANTGTTFLIPTNSPTPTSTNTLRPSPIPTTAKPTHPPKPPPTSTATEIEPPSPKIISCEVNPSNITPGVISSLTYSVHFSSAGYGMIVTGFDREWPGQNGCSAADDDGDGFASCSGSSGLVPPATKVIVHIQTPLGNCSDTYRTP